MPSARRGRHRRLGGPGTRVAHSGRVPRKGWVVKAVVNTADGEGNIKLLDVDRPELGPGQVEVEIKRTAICGTDIQIWHGLHRTRPPVILGHETCGVVSRVGQDVQGWEPGTRVTLETAAEVDGTCLYCRMGAYQLCVNRTGLGTKRNGAFAKYCVVRPDILHVLPDNVSFKAGALSNPVSIALRAVSTMSVIHAGDVALVSGCGGVGLLVLQIAKAEGATVVVLGLSRDKDRLAVALELGADYTVNIEEQSPDDVVKSLTGGYGADVVYECAGAAESVDQCLRLVRKCGQYVQVGIFGKPISCNYGQIAHKELIVRGSYGHDGLGMDRANRLLSLGLVNTERLVTHEFPLSEWRKGFETMESGEGLRILLYPDE
jgi:L-iditol 2-dehydrogenase